MTSTFTVAYIIIAILLWIGINAFVLKRKKRKQVSNESFEKDHKEEYSQLKPKNEKSLTVNRNKKEKKEKQVEQMKQMKIINHHLKKMYLTIIIIQKMKILYYLIVVWKYMKRNQSTNKLKRIMLILFMVKVLQEIKY